MKNISKIVIILLIIAGVIYNITLVLSFDKKYPEETEFKAVVKIISMKTEKERSNAYTVKIINSNIERAKNTKIILYTSKNEELKYGDIVEISGDFSKADVARNYKGFNYRNYLKQNKIYGSIYSKTTKKLGHKSSLIEEIYDLKIKLYGVLEKLYKEDTTAFLKGILLRR